MNDEEIITEFERIEKYLFDVSNWQSMTLTRDWAKAQPRVAGVYVLFEGSTPVYVGESGSLSGRLMDMLDSRHHTVRRSLGEKRFSGLNGYKKASSNLQHPEHIEVLVHNVLKSFKLAVLPIKIGRKEFEEYIFSKYQPELNRKSKRGAKHA